LDDAVLDQLVHSSIQLDLKDEARRVKRRIDSISYSASSIAGSLNAYHYCMKWICNIVESAIARTPVAARGRIARFDQGQQIDP
jgi:hypothetical protein